ncbi:HAD-IIIA family hydrolase [Streptomyces anulatus]|uniref:D-glycero-alpha-D-manno-heptose-1,7-bisphosphate 7-phosphatase n=1 Tax=Streptomyces anulatus TaxID=1892 RepID=UPI002DDA855B|nr:HAD-IIIA family hydrolase [Streptomyces anulatus]WSC66084.1 HAD-IIIA family hydrolase [Streptomyces anulatus]WTC61227.1 HAD-IIIA family hydrolase [Streptomyces anulatus]WTC75766.1 HAD-IIIA family hydrolase [Streptomyces anulatus]
MADPRPNPTARTERTPQLRVVLLDRDGVLNVNRPDHVTRAEQWRWLPGALDACARLTGLGLHLAVVTNQAAIGRGLLTAYELDRIHDRMVADLAAVGVPRPVILHCPHPPAVGCSCRKPRPGLLTGALEQLQALPAQALLVGDHDSDLMAAAAAGCWSLHVRSGRGRPPAAHPGCLGSVPGLAEAAELITTLTATDWRRSPLPRAEGRYPGTTRPREGARP